MRYLLFLLVFILFACNDSSIDSNLKPDDKVNIGIGGEDSLAPPSNYRIINGYLHYDFEGDSVEVQKKETSGEFRTIYKGTEDNFEWTYGSGTFLTRARKSNGTKWGLYNDPPVEIEVP